MRLLRRPYVIINCASSVDGKIALKTRKQTKISSLEDFNRVHILRESVDAILVGIGTVLSDDPDLVPKEKYLGRKPKKLPIRVILDAECRVPNDARVLDGRARTLVFTSKNCNLRNAEIIKVREVREGILDLEEVLEELYKRGVRKLLVEGGGTVIWEFVRRGLFDEIYVYVGSIIIGGRDAPTMAEGDGAGSYEEIIKLKLIEVKRLGDGVLLHYKKADGE